MLTKRVVVTGLGILSPNGVGKHAYWDALINGRSGITRITSFDPSSFNTQIAGEVKGFNPCDYFDPHLVKRSARFTHFGIASSKMALADAGIDLQRENRNRCGVCFGTSVGGQSDIYERQFRKYIQHGPLVIKRFTAPECSPQITTGYICSELKITGPNLTISSGCSTGLDIVNWGFSMIKGGEIDVAVVGSSDAPIFPFAWATFCALGILSKRNEEPEKASRPYDKNRDGLVLSEGGVTILLEELEHALERGADIYAEIISYASSNDTQDVYKIDCSGRSLIFALEKALINAKIRKEKIDYICSHGNSVHDYDLAETNAFKDFFGDYIYKIPISAIKSMTGQVYSAGGGFQLLSACLSLKNGIIPPTINLYEPDPLCDLDYVPHYARYFTADTVLINSHSVGGKDSVLILKKYH